MKNVTLLLCALTTALLISGCTFGLLYTHTWTPLTTDMHETKVAPTTSGTGDIKHIVLLYPAFSVAWDDAALGDIAKKRGLQELYYADLEYFSILHIWNDYTVHLYGK
jgi:hypothetical protein